MCLTFNTLNISVIFWRVRFVRVEGKPMYREEDFTPKILPNFIAQFYLVHLVMWGNRTLNFSSDWHCYYTCTRRLAAAAYEWTGRW